MNLFLRTIDQTGKNSEEETDVFLGKGYTVIMKVANDTEELPESENKFINAVLLHYKQLNGVEVKEKNIDKNIVGIVYGYDNSTLIYKHQVVYIVNENGQTYKRIYGQHKKY